MTFEVWRLVAVKDESRSTWELIGGFSSPRKARARILELAGPNVLSPEEEILWYQDGEGTHTFRIEAVPAEA